MRWSVVVIALSACGRLGFDATSDGGTQADGGLQLAENQIALGTGGSVRRIVVPGSDLSRLYVHYGRSRMFYSDDAAETLRECGLIPTYITAFDANESGRVVAATARGVYESTDACMTFAPIGLQSVWVHTVRLDGSVLYAGPAAGLHRYDAPMWTPIPSPVDGSFTHVILPGAVKLLGGPETVGMLRSTDGVTWNPSATGMQANTSILDVTRVGGAIWTATSTGLYLSTDEGMSWTRRHTGWSDVIAVDPGAPATLAHWSSTLTLSTNSGMTWTDMNAPELARTRVADVAFDPAGSGTAFLASGRGLFRLSRDGTLRELATNIDGWTVNRSVATAAARIVATSAGVLRIPTDGSPHVLIDTGAAGYSQINDIAVFGSSVIAAGRSIGKSDDDGVTYTETYVGDSVDGYQIVSLATTSDSIFGITNGRVLRSTDGITWSGPTIPITIGNTIGVVAGAPHQVIAGSDQSGIFVSTNGGTSYTQASTVRSVYGIQPMPDGSVLVATATGLYRAATAAGPYALYSLSGTIVNALALRGATVFAAINDGIMKSTDGGMSFQPVPGFGGRAPIALEVDATTGDLLVGTNGWGFYRLPSP